MQHNIRPARPADMTALIELCAEHAAYEQAAYNPEGKAGKLSAFLFVDPPRLYALVVEDETGLVGYATFAPEMSTWHAATYLHLDCLYLRPQVRNQGIGAALIKNIAARAAVLGCDHLQWQTPADNENAIRFYHRMGATSKAKQRMYLNP